MFLELDMRPLLIQSRQPAVTGDIGRQDRGEPAFGPALSRSGPGAPPAPFYTEHR